MARYNYSMNRRDKKLAGVCSTIGDVFNIDPTFIRIGFVAAAVLISWKLALIGYVAAGIYLAVQRNKATRGYERRQVSDYRPDGRGRQGSPDGPRAAHGAGRRPTAG